MAGREKSGMNVDSLLNQLALKRPIFHSEADFQHTLAWEVHLSHPAAEVRLERPVERMHLDLQVRYGVANYALELKYQTRSVALTHAGEAFDLRNHSVQDIGRYDFLKDVWRLEQIVAEKTGWDGWAVLLTNDPGYWSLGRDDTVDLAFRLQEERTIDGTLAWHPRASIGTTKGHTTALNLRGTYQIRWHPFSRIDTHEFRYLAINIGA